MTSCGSLSISKLKVKNKKGKEKEKSHLPKTSNLNMGVTQGEEHGEDTGRLRAKVVLMTLPPAMSLQNKSDGENCQNGKQEWFQSHSTNSQHIASRTFCLKMRFPIT